MNREEESDAVIPGTDDNQNTEGADYAGQLKDSKKRPGKTYRDVLGDDASESETTEDQAVSADDDKNTSVE